LIKIKLTTDGKYNWFIVSDSRVIASRRWKTSAKAEQWARAYMSSYSSAYILEVEDVQTTNSDAAQASSPKGID